MITLTPRPAHTVRAYLDSRAANVHESYTGSPYDPKGTSPRKPPYAWQHSYDALKELNWKHVRDGMVWNGIDDRQTAAYEAYGPGLKDPTGAIIVPGLGIGVCVIAGDAANFTTGKPPQPGIVVSKRVLDTWHAQGVLEAVEFPNEWDNTGDTRWEPDEDSWGTLLYNTIRADHSYDLIPIFGPSLTHGRTSFLLLGDLRGISDASNLHDYPGASPMDAPAKMNYALGQITNPGQPCVATEWGYHNDHVIHGGFIGVPEAVSAIYLLNGHFAQLVAGISMSYGYELADNGSWPHWGLYHADWSPKPIVAVFKNVDAYREPDAGPTVAPATAVVTPTPGVASWAMAGSSGAQFVALWQTASIFNPATQVTTLPAPKATKVSCPLTWREMFDPATNTRTPLTPGQTVTVPVGASALILKAA